MKMIAKLTSDRECKNENPPTRITHNKANKCSLPVIDI
jgi:hypothetical protein